MGLVLGLVAADNLVRAGIGNQALALWLPLVRARVRPHFEAAQQGIELIDS